MENSRWSAANQAVQDKWYREDWPIIKGVVLLEDISRKRLEEAWTVSDEVCMVEDENIVVEINIKERNGFTEYEKTCDDNP